MIFLFDLDGTLCDITHRLHFIKSDPQDWRGFFRACVDDQPIDDVCTLCRSLHEMGARIIYVSGRSDEVRTETDWWLKRHALPAGPLFMRVQGDHRYDNIVKGELLDQVIKEYGSREEIAGVFEDRDQVVKMYRERGLRVYQVAEGDF